VPEMEVGPSEAALQEEASNHRQLRRSRAGVVSVAEKARLERVRCESRRRAKANHSMTRRKRIDDSKTEESRCLGISPGVTCLPTGCCPAWRWRELGLGSGRERGNLRFDRAASEMGEDAHWAQERDAQAAETARARVAMRSAGADRPVVAVRRGNGRGAKGAGCPGLFGGQPRVRGRSRWASRS